MQSKLMLKPPKSLNVSLTPELSGFIAGRVASGHYQSASEVVRAGLRLLEGEETGWATRIETGKASGSEAERIAGDRHG